MTNKSRDTFVLHEPSRIVEALVGLKNVRVLAYRRTGPDVELVIEQIDVVLFCPSCGARAQVKDRPVVRYVDLPVLARLSARPNSATSTSLPSPYFRAWLVPNRVAHRPKWGRPELCYTKV